MQFSDSVARHVPVFYTQYSAITFKFNKCLPGNLLVRRSMQINLQHVFKMSHPESTHALSRTRGTPLVNGCVDDVLLMFTAAPNVQQTLSQFVNISNLCLVDALLLCSTDFVITGLRSGLFGGHCSSKSSIVSRARHAGELSC